LLVAPPSKAKGVRSARFVRNQGNAMQFAALLEELKRILVAGFAAAPLAWALALVVLLTAFAAVALRARRPPARRGEIETVYLASAAAMRKSREIGEIDAFTRRVGASVDELKTQLRRLRAGHYTQVKIYIDHSNFIRTWTETVHNRDRPLEHDVDWRALPEVLLGEINTWLTNARKAPQALVYRGTHVYGTLFQDDYFRLLETMLRLEQTSPDRLPLPIRLRKETIERWREENEAHKVELVRRIQNETGYVMVPIYRRTPKEEHLSSSQFTAGGIPIAPEKMLDTHIATDLIGDATFDAYDIALLVSEDSDFIPAVEFVQEMRNKQVVHVGFGDHRRPEDLRSTCRHRIDLARGQLFRRMQMGRGQAAAAARAPVPAKGKG
jgi:uncharacterized LabA/DUF88 family protein